MNCIPCGHRREQHIGVPGYPELYQCQKCTCCRTQEQMGGSQTYCDKCGHAWRLHVTQSYGEVECIACGCGG